MNRAQVEVIIVEDHLTVRKGVELLLRGKGLRVAGVASGLNEARALLERRQYDVALIDIHLGENSSLELVQELLARDPGAPIVLYTGLTGPGSGLTESARAGARGFVLKSSPPDRLVEALRRVADGGSFVDPDLAHELSQGARVSRIASLSPREHEILGLLADGLTGQAIAKRLCLSPETVRTHVRNAITKTGAKTRVEAVALMVRAQGLY